MAWLGRAALILALAAFGGPTMAGVCKGRPPPIGGTIEGAVLHVVDGQTLCVALGPTPDRWVPLMVAPSLTPLPRDRDRLMAATFSKRLSCHVTAVRGPASLAECAVDGRALDSVMSDPAMITEAKAWR
ncbi:MAG: hypothetical protein J7521_19625 [Caulobacter sp.]|nr:hypothetical protein [Caulobacter sp.]